MVTVTELFDQINNSVASSEQLNSIASTLHVKPIFVAVAGLICVGGFFLYGFGGNLVCTLAGLAYPAFASFRALEEFSKSSHQDQEEIDYWLTYWVVFAAISLIESMSYYLLIWFPFYYPLKLSLIIWLFSRGTRGSETAFRRIVGPFLHKHKDTIEEAGHRASLELKYGFTELPQQLGRSAVQISAHGVRVAKRRLSNSGSGSPPAEGETSALFKEAETKQD
eukprot:TRINITY_DN56731_c0_g1_i1.p2 TRINITY_DN56731_c0_g1~~TRINITY_DN56731_c0_g1_i1.p2  ORF type:complete len:223 (-),score=40.28 TRINITY_DN56731_c0_g1_i1:71-739(-)